MDNTQSMHRHETAAAEDDPHLLLGGLEADLYVHLTTIIEWGEAARRDLSPASARDAALLRLLNTLRDALVAEHESGTDIPDPADGE